MESVLKIDKLKYKDVLKEVTFSLEDKSFNILVGSNGSGKTTIVNAIRGTIDYEGTIILFNNILKEKHSLNFYKDVGFFIDDEIFLEDTVYEELLNLLKNLNYEEDKSKKMIFTLAKKLDISDILFKNKEQLLNYEKTLASFIFSVIHEPKLLVIDNDFEDLDLKSKNRIISYLKTQKKITILFITNNSEYFHLADNLLFLNDGKIVLSGGFEDVIEQEKVFIKCGSKLPFNIELSKKLISYELLSTIELDFEKMVNEIWK